MARPVYPWTTAVLRVNLAVVIVIPVESLTGRLGHMRERLSAGACALVYVDVIGLFGPMVLQGTVRRVNQHGRSVCRPSQEPFAVSRSPYVKR